MDYSKLKEITVKTQEELDSIPLDFKGRIYIKFGTLDNKATVKNRYYLSVIALENSSVYARGNSSVYAWGKSSVEAMGNSIVYAWGNSIVIARGKSRVIALENSNVEARENSDVLAWGNSSVVAWENSIVYARENSSVEAWGNSTVEAWDNSTVEAWGKSSVYAWENSNVLALEKSNVVARGNSSVEARGNSIVSARENSSVVARGNAQVVDYLQGAKIKISGNARIVYNPKGINEFMKFYDIKHTKTKAIFYKAVRKIDGKYCADYNNNFIYEIGKEKIEECEKNIQIDCGKGIHISPLNWALEFGKDFDNLAILEVETKIEDIILSENSNGKVRTSRVKVLREVPLEECGLFGKILLKRRVNNGL
jgi:hypothetical protein